MPATCTAPITNRRRRVPSYPTVSNSRLWMNWRSKVYSDTSGTTLAVANGSIARWDAVGGSWGTDSFLQSTSSKQPTLKSDGVQCDGTDDFLQASSSFSLTGDFTAYFAYYISSTTNVSVFLTKQGSGSYYHGFFPSNSDGKAYVTGATAGDSWSSLGTAALRITRFRRSGSTNYMDTYGVAEAMATSGGFGSATMTLDAILGRGGSFSVYTSSTARLNQIVVVTSNLTPGGTDDLAIIAKIQALESGINW